MPVHEVIKQLHVGILDDIHRQDLQEFSGLFDLLIPAEGCLVDTYVSAVKSKQKGSVRDFKWIKNSGSVALSAVNGGRCQSVVGPRERQVSKLACREKVVKAHAYFMDPKSGVCTDSPILNVKRMTVWIPQTRQLLLFVMSADPFLSPFFNFFVKIGGAVPSGKLGSWLYRKLAFDKPSPPG